MRCTDVLVFILFCSILTLSLYAAPVPFLSYEQADTTDSVLRLAKVEGPDLHQFEWVAALEHIRIDEQEGHINEALVGYEQLLGEQKLKIYRLRANSHILFL